MSYKLFSFFSLSDLINETGRLFKNVCMSVCIDT